MATWTTPRTWTEAYLVGASDLNQHLRDNLTALYDAQHDVAARKTFATGTYNMVNAVNGAEMFSDFTWTSDGSSCIVEFFCPSATATGGAAAIHLTNGSGTSIAVLAAVGSGLTMPVFAQYYYTPAAGSVTLNVVGVYGGSAGTMLGGLVGAVTYAPAYLRVYGQPV